MMRGVVSTAAAVLLFLFCETVPAAEIDDARQLFAEQKFEQVDAALKEELAKAKPAVEALKLSLAAARASGRFVTAQKRITKLLQVTGNREGDLVYQGAVIATQSGDDRLAATRFAMYVRMTQDKTPKLERAMRELLRRGVYPDEYERYVSLYGATDDAWRLGLRQLNRLLGQFEGKKALRLADFLLKRFRDRDKHEYLARRLKQASDNFELGKSGEDLYKRPFLLLLDNGVKGISQHYHHHFYNASEKYFGDRERVDNLLRAQALIGAPLDDRFFGRFDRMRAIKSEAARLEAGKRYLALETMYMSSDRVQDAYNYVRLIGDSPQVFAVKNKPLVSGRKLVELFGAMAKKYRAAGAWTDFDHVQRRIAAHYLDGSPVLRTKLIRDNLDVSNHQRFHELLDLTKGADFDRLYARYTNDKSFSQRLTVDVELMGWYNRLKRKDKLTQAATDYVSAYPGSFNHHHVNHNILRSPLLSPDWRVSFVQGLLARGGASSRVREMVKWMGGLKEFKKHAGFKKLKAQLAAGKPGTDPAMAAHVKLCSMPAQRHTFDKRVNEVVTQFLAAYKGRIPGDRDQAADATELLAYDVFERYGVSHSWDSRRGIVFWIENFAPRLTGGRGWEMLIRRGREHGQQAILRQKALPPFVALVKQGHEFKGDTWWRWVEVGNDRGEMTSPLTAVYKQMGGPTAIYHVYNQRGHMDHDRKAYFAELGRVAKQFGYDVGRSDRARDMLHNLQHWAGDRSKVPAALSRQLFETYLEGEKKSGHFNPYYEVAAYGQLMRSRHRQEADAFLQRYFEVISSRSAWEQAEAIQRLVHHVGMPREPDNQLQDRHQYHTILKRLQPLYAKMSPDRRRGMWISNNVMDSLRHVVQHWEDGPEKKAARAFIEMQVDMLLAGSRWEGHWRHIYGPLDLLVDHAIAAEDWDRAATLLAYHAGCYRHERWHDIYRRRIAPNVARLETAKAHELLFVYVSSIMRKHEVPKEYLSKLTLIKSKAAQQIPGLIPVDEKNPAYLLHLASHAYSIGNEGQAWEHTAKQIKLLPKYWDALDPTYVAWALDQMRKQKMLKDALNFAFLILVREADLDPEIAARVSLTKGDIYRDLENFRAARTEYESLRANRRYANTIAGGEAKFHLISLLIQTRDYQTAESFLQSLANSSNIDIQAEAYYFYAKMAFDQADYAMAKDSLAEVFKRRHDHVNARLLEGELQVKTKITDDYPELQIGDARLKTIAIPGRVLTLKLQDKNLSVARGGAAIPVVVTTSGGKDRETVKLLPSSGDRTLFTGKIPTALGVVKQDNLQLEVRGGDTVSYIIDPDFQKANDITYPPKELQVKANGELMASAGEILSKEEAEKRELEERLRRARGEVGSARFRGRSGRTVRPGSPIYIQVVDFDRDLTTEPDTVNVDLSTSSGDVLKNFEVVETEPHSGIFRGKVTTGIPAPRASASDTQEGKKPSWMINSTQTGVWSSLADGKAPKWVEVDTMSSHEMAAAEVVVPEVAPIKRIALYGMLDDDFERLAFYPEEEGRDQGGLKVTVAPDQRGHRASQIRKYIRVRGLKTYHQTKTEFDRDDTSYKGRDGWLTCRMKGVFHLPENRTLELKFLHRHSPHGWQHAYLYIDGEHVLGGRLHNRASMAQTRRLPLIAGVHRFELLIRDHWKGSKVVVGYRTDEDTFEPLPAAWFDPDQSPALAEALSSRATIAKTPNGFKATMKQPLRLRRLKWVFEEFTSNAISVKELRVTDKNRKALIPVEADFTTGTTNQTLEISAGDEILVSYVDERRLDTREPRLTQRLNSSFFNGEIALANEEIVPDERNPERRYVRFEPAKRCRAGDQLMIFVTESDADLTDERDTVEVTVRTSKNEELKLKALESNVNHREFEAHSGTFLAVLKFGDRTGGNTIRVQPGDRITVSYLDRENTRPGIPVVRRYTLFEAGLGEPQTTVFGTKVSLVPDTSAAAKAKIERLRRLGRKDQKIEIFRQEVVATHPDYNFNPATKTGDKDAPIPVSVNAPLLFQVSYPQMALHQGSVMNVTAMSEAEIKLAAEQNRKPEKLDVPMHIRPLDRVARDKGYTVKLRNHHRRNDEQLLAEGVFSGVIRLQIGSHGDAVDDLVVAGEKEFVDQSRREARTEHDDYRYRVPTLLVSGSDVVRLIVKDIKSGKTCTTRVRLLSDGRLEILDQSYTFQKPAVHMGERFYLRLTDPDHDSTDGRDKVKVAARSASGDAVILELSETIGHSGVFSTSFLPEFIKQAKVNTNDNKLSVNFGDDVTFEYVDDLPLSGTEPRRVIAKGRMYFGANGELAGFTKKFKDPEMAVKTRFLMAEALFEMAKDHRKLKRKELADEEIDRGKRILEEALRDYPNTSLAAQGEFLLANLAQELGKHQEAIGRYANVISHWPESEYAARSQFKKAICLEKMKNYKQACEEYVKLTYLYPDSSLVADATVRLGNYFYRNKKFKTAGRIFFKFQQRNPNHRLAVKALFLAGQCNMRQEDYRTAVQHLNLLLKTYADDHNVRAETMYWLAESYYRSKDNVKAYQTFKKLTWDYPETKWAKIARGRLTEEVFARIAENEE